jgi:hypothetical protein
LNNIAQFKLGLKFTKAIIACALVFFVCNLAVYSQFAAEVVLDNSYDDNVFRSQSANGSLINNTTLKLLYSFPDTYFSIQYTGSATLFSGFSSKNYTKHSINTLYEIPLSIDIDDSVTIDYISIQAALTGRLDNEENKQYRFVQTNAFIAYTYNFSDITEASFGYIPKWRHYTDFQDMSYLEHGLSATFGTSFPTKTALGINMNFGYKIYESSSSVKDTVSVPPPPPMYHNNSPRIESEPLPPNKRKYNQAGIEKWFQILNQNQTSTPVILFDSPSSCVLELSLDASQSMDENTGISASYSKKWILDEYGRAYIGGSVDYYSEEELFDDPYSFSSNDFSFKFNHIFTNDYHFEAGAFYSSKDYVYPANLLATDTQNRKDDIYGLWLSLDKTFDFTDFFLSYLAASMNFGYVNNSSNSKYFGYSSSIFTLSLGVGF